MAVLSELILECGGLPPLCEREQAPALQENRLMRQLSHTWYKDLACPGARRGKTPGPPRAYSPC